MLTINATVRKEQGKGASRRLRVANRFPAIVYGGNEEPIAIDLDHNEVINQEHKSEFYADFVNLVIMVKQLKLKLKQCNVTSISQKLLILTSCALNKPTFELYFSGRRACNAT